MQWEARPQLGLSDVNSSIPHKNKCSTSLGCELMSHRSRGARARRMCSLKLPYLTRSLSVLDEQGAVGKLVTAAIEQHLEQAAKTPHPVPV